MHHHTIRILASLLAFLPRAVVGAQSSTPMAIHGRVVRAGSTVAIASATIDVANVVTGTPAGRVASTADGSFKVTGLAPGRYRVSVRALGFGATTLPNVTLSASDPDVDVGVVALNEIPLQLQTQAVTAQRDVLRNVPSVDVDIDNNVSLRGNTGVVIQMAGTGLERAHWRRYVC